MSIPGDNQPPGGYMNTAPTNSNSSAGCWKAFGITCGVLVLLFILGGIFVFTQVAKSPIFSSMKSTMKSLPEAMANGVQIQRAIVSYHNKHGAYPPTLSSLVPEYLPDAKVLHSDLDPDSKDPAHVSWKYFHPNESSAPKSQLIRLDYRFSLDGSTDQKRSMVQSIIVDLDGTQESSQSGIPGGAPGQSPFGTAPGSLRGNTGGSGAQ